MEARAESSFQMMDQNMMKLDHFDGTNFDRWKEKLIFMLTALKIAYVLDLNLKNLLEPKDDDSNQLKAERKKRINDEVLCRCHILNTLLDRLYDLFTNFEKHLRIEEDTRNLQKKNVETIFKVNYVDEKKLNSREKKYSRENSSERKKRKLQKFSSSNAIKIKTNKSCYYCSKKSHFKQNTLVAVISDLHIGMIIELNMTAATKTFNWWYDSSVTIHVCNNKSHFKTFEKVIEGYEVMMENNDNTKVLGKDTVEISFTSKKKLVLVNVLFVLEIRKNLVSTNLFPTKLYFLRMVYLLANGTLVMTCSNSVLLIK
ncbi:hypothetical protein NE237_006328 [Protea cynaroides]|uniref:Retrovirus-related Pol polyprotein from transposon TNT 1-94-like beta-barrel domain-containing protein n=1 Tax=Protea cynaroides TaxID=273540 RepID=A0A9Q0QVE9_9MAGN|nr:hypothetical protein NE237_006328 [Protea cynaroides]